jgi:Zn-dependent M28 family amino/carboxypeptidase
VAESTLAAKEGAARMRGARALIVIGDPTHLIDQADYALFNKDPDAEEKPIPVLRLRRKEAQPLLDQYQLDSLARLIDADLVPRSAVLNGATVTYQEHLSKNVRTVRNVVGVLPGSDSQRAKEAIVIGAHYDHVGLGGHLSMSPDRTGEIHNGADDNASGTSSVIEIARQAAAQRERFPRTLVFVAFAGEERGLLGSAHYVEGPAVPVGDTIAMLNLDMVGRARGNVDVSGLEFAPSMEEDLKAAAQGLRGLSIKREGPGAGRSDDSSFQSKRIPAINFFTGFHGDYHRPGDDWEKIDTQGTSQIATLAFELAARLAARPMRPEFVQR